MAAATMEGAGPSGGMKAPQIDQLVLDAGPLLTQQQGLGGLAKKFYITPSVVAELRDKRAKEHLESLQRRTNRGGGDGDEDDGGDVVEVREPSAEARLAVIAFAKQTGDYAVLSQPDISVLALAYALEVERHGQWRIRDTIGGLTGQQKRTKELQQQQQQSNDNAAQPSLPSGTQAEEVKKVRKRGKKSKRDEEQRHGAESRERGEREEVEECGNDEKTHGHGHTEREDPVTTKEEHVDQAAEEAFTSDNSDDDDEDDEEEGGQWITPENIDAHKSVALGLVSDADVVSFGSTSDGKAKTQGRTRTVNSEADADGWSTVVAKNDALSSSNRRQGGKAIRSDEGPANMTVACMTGDYAVQNVLLQMGLSLVGLQGQRIRQVRAWVLRCHACFKICKDVERQSTFCPQCGNPTLLRTSVTSRDPSVGGGMQVHLRKNFQYKNRGTKYSLPLPKAGKAGGGPQANVPILREDQAEWQRALDRERVQRRKEERALQKALERGEKDTLSARYDDADGLSILLAGKSASRQAHGLPALGVGRRNPNEKQRRKV